MKEKNLIIIIVIASIFSVVSSEFVKYYLWEIGRKNLAISQYLCANVNGNYFLATPTSPEFCETLNLFSDLRSGELCSNVQNREKCLELYQIFEQRFADCQSNSTTNVTNDIVAEKCSYFT